MWFLILWLHLQFEVFHSHFTHVVSRGRYIALRVGDTDKALYAVILKRGGNLTVRTALPDGLQGLATAIGIGMPEHGKTFKDTREISSDKPWRILRRFIALFCWYFHTALFYLKNDWHLILLHRIAALPQNTDLSMVYTYYAIFK